MRRCRSCAGWLIHASAPRHGNPRAKQPRAGGRRRARALAGVLDLARRAGARRRGHTRGRGFSWPTLGLPTRPAGAGPAPARRDRARPDRPRHLHGLRLVGALERRRRRSRPRGRPRLDRRQSAGAGADRADRRRRGDAAAPGVAGAASAADGRDLPVGFDHAGAGRGHAGRELDAGRRRRRARRGPRRSCRRTAASRARRSTRARTGWCRASAWTSSWSSCSSSA